MRISFEARGKQRKASVEDGRREKKLKSMVPGREQSSLSVVPAGGESVELLQARRHLADAVAVLNSTHEKFSRDGDTKPVFLSQKKFVEALHQVIKLDKRQANIFAQDIVKTILYWETLALETLASFVHASQRLAGALNALAFVPGGDPFANRAEAVSCASQAIAECANELVDAIRLQRLATEKARWSATNPLCAAVRIEEKVKQYAKLHRCSEHYGALAAQLQEAAQVAAEEEHGVIHHPAMAQLLEHMHSSSAALSRLGDILKDGCVVADWYQEQAKYMAVPDFA